MCSNPSGRDTIRPSGKAVCSPQSDVQVTGALFLYESYRLLTDLDVEHLLGLRKMEPKYVCQSEAKTSHSHSHVLELRFRPPLHTSQIKDCRLASLCRNVSAGVCDSS